MPVSARDVARSIRMLVRQNRISSLIYSLVVPLIIGVYATFYSDLMRLNPLLFWGPVIFFVGFALVSAYFTFDVVLAPEVYMEMQQAEDRIFDLETYNKFLAGLQEQTLVWGAMVREHVKNADRSAEHLRETISEMGSLLVENRDNLFGFASSELWSFAIYIYHERDDLLRAVWRAKHHRHPSPGMGRDWAPGIGHVGIAFAQAEPKICPDAFAPGVWEMFSPSEGPDYDRSAYVSFVSEPIGPVGPETKPFGVLVATSSHQGRFDIVSSLALRHAASAIATLVYLAYDRATLENVCDSAQPNAT